MGWHGATPSQSVAVNNTTEETLMFGLQLQHFLFQIFVRDGQTSTKNVRSGAT